MENLDGLAEYLRTLFETYPHMRAWVPVFAFGSVVALFKSSYDKNRRSAWLLFVEAFFGGVCGVIAFDASKDSWAQLLWTAGAAIGSGGIVQGINRASNQFADKPFEIMERIWNMARPMVEKMFESQNSNTEVAAPSQNRVEGSAEEVEEPWVDPPTSKN